MPAEELEEFKDHIAATIAVTSVFVEIDSTGAQHLRLTDRLIRHTIEQFGTDGAAALGIVANAYDHTGTPADERLAAAIVLGAESNRTQPRSASPFAASQRRSPIGPV